MVQVAFGQSKYYSDNLAENVKRGIRQKLRRGEYLGLAPFVYVNNQKTLNIEPHPVKSKLVRRMFQEFAEGKHSLESIRHRLYFWGVANRRRTFGKSAVQRILTNRTYIGIMTIKGEDYEDDYEPLVDSATFEAVQRALKQNSRPRRSTHKLAFPFTGLLTCGK